MGGKTIVQLASRGASLVIDYAKGTDTAQKVVSEIESTGGKAIAFTGKRILASRDRGTLHGSKEHYVHIGIVISNSSVESSRHTSQIPFEEFS